ncbi:MAG TPA: hypothetical protein VFY43_05505, partial [Candidatus Limnocylindria bacterium]|nr:hypothetical protein [Candidatus Limnocylindria bacterium]
MGWLEGVLTGYADRHYEIEAEKRREAELAATREQQVYETLLNSKYPEIKNLAAAGVLDLANPRRKAGGFAGWMGEIQKSPYLGMIQRTRQQIADDPAYADAQLGRTSPEQGGQPPVTPSIPSSAGSVAPPPPGAPSAALPSTSQ